MRTFFSLAVLLFASSLLAANKSSQGTDLPLKKGSLIRVISYDPRTKTYEVESANFPGEGESNVTPEALATAAPSAANLQKILRNPESIVDQEFQINGDLPTLFDKEREARVQGSAPAPSAPVKKSQNRDSGTR